jgi:hypothetical protein
VGRNGRFRGTRALKVGEDGLDGEGVLDSTEIDVLAIGNCYLRKG